MNMAYPNRFSLDLDSRLCKHIGSVFVMLREPPWYGTVCPVVWEDGGSNPASYPILCPFRALGLKKTAENVSVLHK